MLSVYWKALPLRPGLYKVDIVIKDVNNPDHIGRWQRSVNVPKYDDDHLASSSLILAEQMERVPSKDIGAGSFVIGNTHIVPRVPTGVAVPVTFHRAQNLNFWMQVYNLGIDEKSKTEWRDDRVSDSSIWRPIRQSCRRRSRRRRRIRMRTRLRWKDLAAGQSAAGKISDDH